MHGRAGCHHHDGKTVGKLPEGHSMLTPFPTDEEATVCMATTSLWYGIWFHMVQEFAFLLIGMQLLHLLA